MAHSYNDSYSDQHLNHLAFPMGGMGAGMLCLEGGGALSHVSIRGKPELLNEPLMFAALCVKGKRNVARVLEGPVPRWKVFTLPQAGNGLGGTDYGLPRFDEATFTTRYPFGSVQLHDEADAVEGRTHRVEPLRPRRRRRQ